MATLPPSEPGPPGPPFTAWQRLGLQPDAGVYVQRDDQLYIRTRASLAVHVNVAIRLQMPEAGQIVPQLFDVVTVADRSAQLAIFGLAEGFLLTANVFSVDAAMDEGAVYVEVGIVRGGVGLVARSLVLVRGYLDVGDALSWPGPESQGAGEMPGRYRLITGADPAAGAESTETVPAGARWHLVTWRITLVTSAVVGARTPRLVLDDGATTFWAVESPIQQQASATINYNAALHSIVTANWQFDTPLPLPFEVELRAGYRIRTQTDGILGGDNYSAPVYLVREQLMP